MQNLRWIQYYKADGIFPGKMDLVINHISRLEGKWGEEISDDDNGICCLFE